MKDRNDKATPSKKAETPFNARAEVAKARADDKHGDISDWLKDNNQRLASLKAGEWMAYHLKGYITDDMIKQITTRLIDDGWPCDYIDDEDHGRHIKFTGNRVSK